jgi:hypothetical protein
VRETVQVCNAPIGGLPPALLAPSALEKRLIRRICSNALPHLRLNPRDDLSPCTEADASIGSLSLLLSSMAAPYVP